MSSSTECLEFSARRLPEKKQSFSQTCSRLSRYLKENGSFGDLNLEMTRMPDLNGGFAVSHQPRMMNLFPCKALGNDSSSSVAQNVKPKNLFLQQSSFSSSSGTKEEVNNIKEAKSQSAPLTIFYGGQVIVFDEFPAENAKQIIDLAKKGSATGFRTEMNNNQSVYTQNLAKNQNEIASSSNPVPSTAKPASQQEPIQPTSSSLACELPIARRASLHRFLEKRKDRVTSKAPYQIDRSMEASSDLSWFGKN